MQDRKDNNEEIFSKSLRCGRRTYFFDVRSTKAEDYYLTITESKRFFNDDGTSFWKKHKIYLYKEDFKEFESTLNEMVKFIFDNKGEEVISVHSGKQNDNDQNAKEEDAKEEDAKEEDAKEEDAKEE